MTVTDKEARLWISARAAECERLFRDPMIALRRSDEFGYEGRILRQIEKMILASETQTPPDQSARIAELEAEVEALKRGNASFVQEHTGCLCAELSETRNKALAEAVKAVEDAGGTNECYHADAIRALKGKGE